VPLIPLPRDSKDYFVSLANVNEAMSTLAARAAYKLQLHSFYSRIWPGYADSDTPKETSNMSCGSKSTDYYLARKIGLCSSGMRLNPHRGDRQVFGQSHETTFQNGRSPRCCEGCKNAGLGHPNCCGGGLEIRLRTPSRPTMTFFSHFRQTKSWNKLAKSFCTV
jgi:hypothetical protein